MKLDYSKIEEQSLPNFKGGEKSMEAKMFFDGKCRILKARLQPGASIGMHKHETNLEVIYVLKGNGTFIYDGESCPIEAGNAHYCAQGHTHSLINTGNEDLEFIGVVPEVQAQ